MKAEHLAKFGRTEMRMIRWMCGVRLSEKITNVKLREKMGVEMIDAVIRRNKFKWFGHVVRKDDAD